jgi:hypothetical protein
MSHEATISHIFHHLTISNQADVIQAPINHQIIAFVVDTGAFKNVAIFNHKAAHNNVDNIITIN